MIGRRRRRGEYSSGAYGDGKKVARRWRHYPMRVYCREISLSCLPLRSFAYRKVKARSGCRCAVWRHELLWHDSRMKGRDTTWRAGELEVAFYGHNRRIESISFYAACTHSKMYRELRVEGTWVVGASIKRTLVRGPVIILALSRKNNCGVSGMLRS